MGLGQGQNLNPEPRPPAQEITQSTITRVLTIGFTLAISFLVVGGTIVFRNVLSVRNNVAELMREENVNRRLILELQQERAVLAGAYSGLPTGGNQPAAFRQAEAELQRIEAEAMPAEEDKARWRRLRLAARELTASAESGREAAELLLRYNALGETVSEIVAAGFARTAARESRIGDRIGAFTGQSVALLLAALGLATVCGAFTIRATRQLFRNMAARESELARVSWQMLADQESIARRFSHELHDELGQTLAAIRANLISATGESRAADTIALTDEAINGVRQLSQLLRPTILDDFGLDAGLNWLCEGFMKRTGISVEYRSEGWRRLSDMVETHLFRIAQEALTNVARHSGATRVIVGLTMSGSSARLRIVDNGKGLPSGDPQAGFGLTGMRARARVAGGVLETRPVEGGGLNIEVEIERPSEAPRDTDQ